MVRHVDHLLGDDQKHPLPFFLPVALAGLGEVTKVLLVAMHATHKFHVSVNAVVGHNCHRGILLILFLLLLA